MVVDGSAKDTDAEQPIEGSTEVVFKLVGAATQRLLLDQIQHWDGLVLGVDLPGVGKGVITTLMESS